MATDGPSITSMSTLLTEPLDLYLTDLDYDSAGNETPYLFHPTNDTTRCLPSSQWTAVVKVRRLKTRTHTQSFDSSRHLISSVADGLQEARGQGDAAEDAARELCARRRRQRSQHAIRARTHHR